MRRRRTFDDHGRPIVEVESDTGTFRQEIDTARVRQLRGDALSLEEPDPGLPSVAGSWGEFAAACAPGAAPRRSGLDRLRALSEAIKRRRACDAGGGREGDEGG